MMRLRPYQVEAVDAAVEALWGPRGLHSVAMVLPTAAGKTVIFSGVAKRFRETVGVGKRVLIVSHRTELVAAAAEKVRSVDPGCTVGVVEANTNETLAQVISASVPTLAGEARRNMIRDVGLIIVDECFPAGTLIGGRAIESLAPGDLVPSWDEETGREVAARVARLMKRIPKSLVRIRTEAEDFSCTANHPILTTGGWVPAGMLTRDDLVVSFHHADASQRDMYGMLDPGDIGGKSEDRLLGEVRPDVLLGPVSRRVGEARSISPDVSNQSEACIGANEVKQPDGAPGCPSANGGHSAQGEASAEVSRGQREAVARAAIPTSGAPRLADGGCTRPSGWEASVSLQAGYSPSGDDGLRGGGWGVPFRAGAPRVRPAPGRAANFARVVDVQILEPGRDGTYGGVCPDGAVYNIEVEGTHTYLIGNGTVVHNCHHAAAATYRKIARHYGVGEPGGAKLLGVTATLSRGDGKALGDVFQDIVYEVPISTLIEGGWLIRPRGLRVWVDDLDMTRVRSRAGDYQADDLGRAIEESQAPAAIAKAIREHAPRAPTVIFAPTVASADLIREACEEAGFTAALVHGAMEKADRRKALADFRAGLVQVLCNCMVLTEGTDLPLIECVVIARQTKHSGLYIQMGGRGLRISPETGKTSCLILDVVGASQVHSLEAHVELFGVPLDDENSKVKRKPVELLDDEDAELDDDAAEWVAPERQGVGTLIVEEVNLFHASPLRWHQTSDRTSWFLLAPGRFIVVHPSLSVMGAWDISSVDAYNRGEGSARWIAQGIPDLAYARGWGEDDMSAKERRMMNRGQAWRVRAADTKLRAVARQWGVRVQPGMNAGEVQGQIDVAMAKWRLGR